VEGYMERLLGSSIDHKNIELAKTLFCLRQDMDIHCLIAVNVPKIKANGIGTLFFGHVQKRMIESIVLAICKLYEDEKRNELNSIQGVLNSLFRRTPPPTIEKSSVQDFVKKQGGPYDEPDLLKALQTTFDQFRSEFSDALSRFKTARDKLIAHSDYQVTIDNLPSFDTMERLFYFGADFYAVVSSSFVGCGPDDLRNRREVKSNFRKLLAKIGISDIETDMK
jgi:AbiU2